MYHHQQQPSYNPYAAANLPQYAAQYGNWPEQPGQEDPMTAHSFSVLANKAENQVYLNQVTSELEQRAISDERLGGLAQRHGVDTQHAQQAERDRRLRWAQEMIIQNPALCAEVYCAMSKRPSAPPRRDSSRSSTATMGASRSNSSSSNSSYRGSPT
ncbi:hypothetical protein SLS58_002504 [Diplodia intermedia]|uniref:Uncharacterized protein n=1 Tax=Diplodia intermedia TaxID=856260 RepID=A0ABR3TZI4_9PEZI